jgi:hypothetical protein
MKKMYVIMLALISMTLGSSLQADEVKETVAKEEQAFAEKLSETHRALFSAMTVEQKAAAMTASVEPDVAVEQVIQELSIDNR